MNKVYKLIHHYGESLGESHGDNLFYLLDIEGKIVISPDEGTYKLTSEDTENIDKYNRIQ